jgi:hypothetical protein
MDTDCSRIGDCGDHHPGMEIRTLIPKLPAAAQLTALLLRVAWLKYPGGEAIRPTSFQYHRAGAYAPLPVRASEILGKPSANGPALLTL